MKKADIISKAANFPTCNLMDSAVHQQMHDLGIVINRSGQKNLNEYCRVGINNNFLTSHT